MGKARKSGWVADDVPTEELSAAAPADLRPKTPKEMGRDRVLAWAQTGWNANFQRKCRDTARRGPVTAPFFAKSVVVPLPPVDSGRSPSPRSSKKKGAKGKTRAQQKADEAGIPPSSAASGPGYKSPRPTKTKKAHFLHKWAERANKAEKMPPRVDGSSFRIQVKRFMEIEWRSAKMAQLLMMFGGLILPTLDTVMDWAVMLEWVASGQTKWFGISLAIQIVSGLAAGAMLGWSLIDHVKSGFVIVLISLTAGVSGFSTLVMVALALYTEEVRDAHTPIELVRSVLLLSRAMRFFCGKTMICQDMLRISAGSLTDKSLQSNFKSGGTVRYGMACVLMLCHGMLCCVVLCCVVLCCVVLCCVVLCCVVLCCVVSCRVVSCQVCAAG